MPRINVLPKSLSDLIAAGEVVERPSSVIKEFLENSIDAGSKNITVEIQCGGKTFMRITDDGCGILREDVKKAFLSHATSKISTASDLDSISTLGFRGEALASVAAVSKTEMLTKTPESENGTRCIFEGGEESLFDDAGCPSGTTIIVRDLFYNVPARMKFLKKDMQEGNYISAVMERIAVSNPNISFRYIRDGKKAFQTPGDGDLKSAVYAVFGKEFTEGLLPVDYESNGMAVKGFTAKPTAGKNSRSMQIFFVNGRYVKSPVFMSALEASYKNSILIGKFPPCVLFVTMPFSAVDVNVHPAKTEVRFFDERRVFDAVYHASFNALNADFERPKASFSLGNAFSEAPVKGEQLKIRETVSFKEDKPQTQNYSFKNDYSISEYGSPVSGGENVVKSPEKGEEKALDFLNDEYVSPIKKQINISIDYQEPAKAATAVKNEPVTEVDFERTESNTEQPFLNENAVIPDFRIIGEAFKTYIFVECEKKIVMIDKHAAHERILFEKFRSEAAEPSMQLLLQPVTVSLSPDEYAAVIENTDLLNKAGFEVSDFGDRCVKVSACPPELVSENTVDLITEIAGFVASNKKTVMPEKLDWIYHSMACRAAIKAGNTTTPFELEHFVKELFSRDDIKYCPHGRPVMVEITKTELEKQFKRIV